MSKCERSFIKYCRGTGQSTTEVHCNQSSRGYDCMITVEWCAFRVHISNQNVDVVLPKLQRYTVGKYQQRYGAVGVIQSWIRLHAGRPRKTVNHARPARPATLTHTSYVEKKNSSLYRSMKIETMVSFRRLQRLQ